MKVALFADGLVGAQIFKFLDRYFPSDLSLLVCWESNDLFNETLEMGYKPKVFRDQPESLKLELQKVDVGILAWWPKKIGAEYFELPAQGFINLHPSFLPFGKGKDPNFWAIAEGHPFGVSIHRVNDDIDAGPIVARREIPITWEDTGGSIYEKALLEIVALFGENYPVWREDGLSTPLDNAGLGIECEHLGCHRRRDLEQVSRIDLNKNYSARQFLNLARAKMFPGRSGLVFEEFGRQYEIRIGISEIRHSEND